MKVLSKINDFIKKDYKSANLNAGFMINPYSFGGALTFISATGGTITTDGNYKVHSFTTSGTFTTTIGTDPTDGNKVQYLVIAGGGGGGDDTGGYSCGGGGAGGYLTATGFISKT